MRFSEIEHQQRALSILKRALRSGRTHHAYLFEGPPGVGKELTARALAARLLCEAADLQPDADACGACRSCHLLAAENHPDFHLIHRGLHKLHPDRSIRASKGLFLAVDVIRHFLIEPATTSPALGRRRVFVIRDAERMNEGAQNALLKTLEEPPGSACLVLVSSSAERLLPTIRSRCQRIPFDLLPTDFVARRLQELTRADADAARTLATLSQGSLGAALHWHRLGLLDSLTQVAHLLAADAQANPEQFAKALLEIAEELALRDLELSGSEDEEGAASRARAKVDTDQMRQALKLTLMLIAAVCRDALVRCETSAAQRCLLPPDLPAPQRLARQPGTHLADCIAAVADTERLLDRNVAPQLACERLAALLSPAAPAPARR